MICGSGDSLQVASEGVLMGSVVRSVLIVVQPLFCYLSLVLLLLRLALVLTVVLCVVWL